MKAAIYIRVSTDLQVKEGNSIEAQKEKLIHYAKAKELSVTKLYIDEGVSGATIDDRKELIQLLEDAKNKVFEAVLVYKLDRLGRNARDLLDIKNRFKDLNINLISLSENIDTTTPTGNAMYGMISVFAELEKDTITGRMQMGREQKVRKGIKSKTGKILYGYDYVDGQYIKNEQQAAIVQLIYKKIIAGKSIRGIAKYLTEHKISRTHNNTYWSPSAVRRLILNPTYKGFTFASLFQHANNKYWDFDNAIIEKANNVEPIIDEDTYELANTIVASRKGNNTRKYAKSDFYFADVAYCADCGWKLYAKNATVKSGTGRRRRYYRCYYNNNHYTSDRCSFGAIENSVLEELFLEYLAILELSLADAEELISNGNEGTKVEAVIESLDARRHRLKARKDRLLEKYLDGHIDDEVYAQTSANIGDEITEIESTLKSYEQKKKPKEALNYNLDLLRAHLKLSDSSIREMWNALNDDEKRMFVTTLVKKLYVAKRKIVTIVFN